MFFNFMEMSSYYVPPIAGRFLVKIKFLRCTHVVARGFSLFISTAI